MSKFAVCINYIERSSTVEILDVFMPLLSGGQVGLIIDSDFEILKRYGTKDRIGLVRTLTERLIDEGRNRFYVKKIAGVSADMEDIELALAIAEASVSDRKLVVDDTDDYHSFNQRINMAAVRLISRRDALAAIQAVKPPFDFEKLTRDLVVKASRICERVGAHRLEDLNNDLFTDFLRDRDYQASDQTRSGRSSSGRSAGELDIAIRIDGGRVVSIIEAFRLSSCGKKNTVVAEHINKLLYSYDANGCYRNFILIYAENNNFIDLWKKYCSYISDINLKLQSDRDLKLVSFDDISPAYDCGTDIRVGLAKHERAIASLEIVHIFIRAA